MTDYFSLLNEPRRPWLEPEALKQKFLELSANVHPDRVHHLGEAERAGAQERSTRLNAAYQCLRQPKDRLRHLLELEIGALPKDIQRVPSDLMDLSLEVGGACREADALLEQKSKATSALLKVQFFERGQEQIELLQALQQKIDVHLYTLTHALRALDAEWTAVPDPGKRADLIQRLEELYRLLSYFSRWTAQTGERIAQLAF